MPSWMPFTARRPPPPYACRLGELALAAASFRQVPADEPRIYDYAVFQASKIYKALERYDQLRSHLQDYVDRPDANERPRVSEALYWIGWSLQQEDRSAEAFPSTRMPSPALVTTQRRVPSARSSPPTPTSSNAASMPRLVLKHGYKRAVNEA